MSTPITLPLPPEMTRCRGEGPTVGEICGRREDCGRFRSVAMDAEPLPAYFGACCNGLWTMHVPIAGYPEDDAA